MTERSYMDAINAAYRAALEGDPDTFVMGEDIRRAVTGTTKGLAEVFDAPRVRDLPMSEAAFTGIAMGAALRGKRPIVEYQINTLQYLAMDQIANNIRKVGFMSGGQFSVPLVLTIAGSGAPGGSAAQHSDNAYPSVLHYGVKTIVPTTPADVEGLFATAVADDDLVMAYFPAPLMGSRGEVPDGDHRIPLGEASIRRAGSDATVVAIGEAVPAALEAADSLAAEIDVEVIDPRTLLPLDEATIAESVRKTGRLVVVDPANRTCGVAAEIAARIADTCVWSLDAPIKRVTRPDAPISYAPAQERYVLPDADRIERAVDDVTW